MSEDLEYEADLLVVGGGFAGLALALALANGGLEVAVVDRSTFRQTADEAFDGRSSAIAYASCKLLEGINVWPDLEEQAGPIHEIRVSDGPSKLFLHFDQQAVGDEPLGHMIENRHLRLALHRHVLRHDRIRVLAPDTVMDLTRDASGVTATLESGGQVRAALCVGADGRNSATRDSAGIAVTKWGYGQFGIVATVEHSLPHHGIAHERFLPEGPFAMLPLTENRVSLVWTTTEDLAGEIMALSERAFAAEVRKRMGDFLGETTIVGGRWSFPLTLNNAERYADTRLALIGDAAHGMHPIAGQGLNLAIRDVAALAEVLIDAVRLGQDIGSDTVLARYEKWRRFDSVALLAVTDGLNRLFSNDIAPVRLARDLGLAAVHRMPGLKRFFINHARGTVGQLPKLLSGEAP